MNEHARPDGGELLVALYGPTSSGKTALSVDVAERIERDLGRRVVVVSADSRQVYRYMDIGTSKTTSAEMHGIRHEMLDVVEPIRKLELEQYARLAREHMTDAFVSGQVPFIVGGTGVYLTALLEGWEVHAVGAARAEFRRDFLRSMTADAFAMLRRLDRSAAARVHPNNHEAIINALAAVMGGGSRSGGASARHRDASHRSRASAARRVVVLGLDPGAPTIDQRIERTYDDQVRRGLFNEIQYLADRYDLDRRPRRHGTRSENQVLHTHGYREYFEVAAERGKPVTNLSTADLVDVRERVLNHIRGYARRQRSWMRKLSGVVMVKSAANVYGVITRGASG